MYTMSNKPDIQYMKVSGENCTVEVEFNGKDYDFTCNDTFIGTIERQDIPRYTNGFELEHVTGWGL